ARKREIAIRISLGAGRARLIRQLLIESVMLASLGGVLGILVSFWSSNLLTLLIPPADFPIGLQLGVDGRVLAFSFTLMVLSGIVFGLVPALQATRSDVVSSLKDEAGAVAGGRGKARLRNSLVVAQVSLSLVLLVAAGLFIRSIDRARSFSPGFNPQNVLLMNYDLFSNGYDAPRGTAFHKQLLERMQALPGVKSVTLCRRIPLGFGGRSSTSFQVEGYTPGKDESVWAYYNKGGPNFLTTMEIPLVSGRDFSFQDTLETQRVAIINQTLAQRYWKDRDPIGQRINFGGEWTTIVGVARDFKLDQLNEPPAPFVLLPLLQSYSSGVTLELRTASNPTAIAGAARQVFQELDSQLPVYSVRTLEGHISAASFQQRMAGSLLGVFGALALVLAAVGLYGVMAYTVAQRTHEIGVRMALGARRADILQMILRTGMSVTGIGVALGLAAAFGASRLLAKLLFGVSPNDAVTYSGVAVLLLAVALLACWIPARRATRVNPIIALRYE
ncbi:MAG: FtsX-like permease family protein, partial [Acidobacteria bacterium]|nr:FtsX-like permease family protein [Acidobacteriota bacterium]